MWKIWNQLGWSGCLAITSTFALAASSVKAQLIPDRTLGTENSTITPQGVRDLIEGGARRGSNLFHSFFEFNIDHQQQVYFANPAGVANILTRVTGNNASNILGTLGVEGTANLFLINPNGIIFGGNARLDISGSFVASTADGIKLGEMGMSPLHQEALGKLVKLIRRMRVLSPQIRQAIAGILPYLPSVTLRLGY